MLPQRLAEMFLGLKQAGWSHAGFRPFSLARLGLQAQARAGLSPEQLG